jgi:hypothetical protein
LRQASVLSGLNSCPPPFTEAAAVRQALSRMGWQAAGLKLQKADTLAHSMRAYSWQKRSSVIAGSLWRQPVTARVPRTADHTRVLTRSSFCPSDVPSIFIIGGPLGKCYHAAVQDRGSGGEEGVGIDTT